MQKSPLRFHPRFKSVLWGGSRISRYKGMDRQMDGVGESWEISAIPGNESVVAEGPYRGLTLREMASRFGEELLGKRVAAKYGYRFPLLVKLIDADDNLSVQVHPGDDLAIRRHNCVGKTEMWYIISTEGNARIYSGLNRELTEEEYERLVEEGRFQSVLAEHPSAPGDVFFIPPGRVHTIGKGNLLAEIQQSSDITYRIYDYGRLDADGKPRPLHTDLAREAIDFRVYDDYRRLAAPSTPGCVELTSCEHFTANRITVEGPMPLDTEEGTFTVLLCISGTVKLSWSGGDCTVTQGHSLLLPAVLAGVSLSGKGVLLEAHC